VLQYRWEFKYSPALSSLSAAHKVFKPGPNLSGFFWLFPFEPVTMPPALPLNKLMASAE
jgi:hypothetical protein